MARPSNKAERRAEIARGLKVVMAAKGWDGATVQDVARAAGLTPGLVHYHFTNKREILFALLEGLAEGHLARLDDALAAAAPEPMAQVTAFIDAHLALSAADPEALACWITISGEALRDPELRARHEAALLEARDRLARVLAPVVGEDAAAAASAVVAAIQGYFVLSAAAPGLVPPGSAAPAVSAMARGLLAGPAGELGPRRPQR